MFFNRFLFNFFWPRQIESVDVKFQFFDRIFIFKRQVFISKTVKIINLIFKPKIIILQISERNFLEYIRKETKIPKSHSFKSCSGYHLTRIPLVWHSA